MKLKLGNSLHELLKDAGEKAGIGEELKSVLKSNGLAKNRKSERIIYGEFKGGDVTKFGYCSYLYAL